MRWSAVPLLVLPTLAAFTLVPSVAAAPREGSAYHIVLPRRAISAGEQIELKMVPPAPAGLRVNWDVASGTGGIGLHSPGIYRAPYIIPAGTPPARVSASFSGAGFRAGATAEIELTPSSLPGAVDCLGPGQSFSTVLGAIEPGYTLADELPQVIHRVDPDYPRSAFVRGVEDTMAITALVCRSGRVLDAYAPASYLNPRDTEPVERDPKLIAAALAAVRQYVFKPATVAGQPIAVWVAVVVAFRR
jgi:hypothetical protein